MDHLSVKHYRTWEYNSYFHILEGLAPYRGQTSSSCGGLVAFGHQMGALQAPWLANLKLGALCAPRSSSCWGLMAFVHLIWAMFVYGFGCFQEVSLKALWRSDLIWLRYLGSKNVYFFVCLLLICLFIILIILGHPQDVTLTILFRSDLIWLGYLGSKMFVCLLVGLFIYWFVFVILIIFGYPQEYIYLYNFGKIWLDLAEIYGI